MKFRVRRRTGSFLTVLTLGVLLGIEACDGCSSKVIVD